MNLSPIDVLAVSIAFQTIYIKVNSLGIFFFNISKESEEFLYLKQLEQMGVCRLFGWDFLSGLKEDLSHPSFCN